MKTANGKSNERAQPAGKKARTRDVLGPRNARFTIEKDVDAKWTWHWRVLMGMRDRLLAEREERQAEGSQPIEPHSMDLADSATDEFDHEIALAELSAGQDTLFEIEEALKRIVDGSYGRCGETGQEIPAARLRAIPWTRFAAPVEARLERKGIVAKPHLGALGSVRRSLTGDIEKGETADEEGLSRAEDVARHRLNILRIRQALEQARSAIPDESLGAVQRETTASGYSDTRKRPRTSDP